MWNRYLLRRTTIVSVATDSQAADKISKWAIAWTEIEGHGAACWWGPPRHPEKAALDCYSGGPRYRPWPADRPILRAAEQRAGAGVGHQGAPKKWSRRSEIQAHVRARCQTNIEGLGAGRWRGPPRLPKKAALDRFSGKPRYRPAPARAARPILRAAEERAGGGHQVAPKKQPGTAIRGYENAGLPRYNGVRDDEKSA